MNKDGFAITVNGKTVEFNMEDGDYASIERTWKKGDIIKIKLPMSVGIEMLPDGSPWGSFTYGPVVLGAATDSTNLVGLVADDSGMGHVAEGKFLPVDEAPVIVKERAISIGGEAYSRESIGFLRLIPSSIPQATHR